MKRPIPRHEPEIIEANRQKGPLEYKPTSAVSVIKVRGVTLTSRNSMADELELMRKVVEDMPTIPRQMMEALFCDSKACCVFTVTLRDGGLPVAERVGVELDELLLKHNGGHNGIWFEQLDHQCEPNWLGDELF